MPTRADRLLALRLLVLVTAAAVASLSSILALQ
jgi:hypothetical protein